MTILIIKVGCNLNDDQTEIRLRYFKFNSGSSTKLNQYLRSIKQQQNRIRFRKVDLSHIWQRI